MRRGSRASVRAEGCRPRRRATELLHRLGKGGAGRQQCAGRPPGSVHGLVQRAEEGAELFTVARQMLRDLHSSLDGGPPVFFVGHRRLERHSLRGKIAPNRKDTFHRRRRAIARHEGLDQPMLRIGVDDA